MVAEWILNPRWAALWLAMPLHCLQQSCPVLIFHTSVVAVPAAITVLVLLVARELWFLDDVLRRQI